MLIVCCLHRYHQWVLVISFLRKQPQILHRFSTNCLLEILKNVFLANEGNYSRVWLASDVFQTCKIYIPSSRQLLLQLTWGFLPNEHTKQLFYGVKHPYKLRHSSLFPLKVNVMWIRSMCFTSNLHRTDVANRHLLPVYGWVMYVRTGKCSNKVMKGTWMGKGSDDWELLFAIVGSFVSLLWGC